MNIVDLAIPDHAESLDNEPARQLAEIERRLNDDRLAASRRSKRLGDTLSAMGLLSERHVKQIARIQAETGEPFGKIAIRKGFVKPSAVQAAIGVQFGFCLLYTSPSPRDQRGSRMPSSA